MSLDEETLETVANGGSIDFEKWPSMVEPLLERLEYIVYNVFPMPQVSPESTAPISQPQPTSSLSTSFLQEPNSIPTSSNKENATPADSQTSTQPTEPSGERILDTQPQSSASPTLPTPLHLLLDSAKSTLRSLFSTKPPHTIQRLAELIIRPNKHYKTLPAYLRAVDRVVSVTSSADIFPLKTHASGDQSNGILNGAESGLMFSDHALGSDESLGGALLTPIPWLGNVASPDAEDEGGASLPEDHDAMSEAVPQQHPLQQETDGAAEPVLTHPTTSVIENEAMEDTGPQQTDPSEDIPHARGPRILGVEDMGLQDGKGVEMTLENEEANSNSAEENGQQGSDANQTSTKENADGDGDITLDDAKNANAEVGASTKGDEQPKP
ncbi:hypothetical protein ABOM_004491 [Aspergillus bombycis]|uniref:Protein phosphatase 4 core regulatory subunit R2 n=1 Tax=Aspergillus bombycis TaxID=109264 RepID=A0A1F8A5J5_9EURO|nr:hypothetical protein ABOM_004491 [Aspergillus bombycis]OGM46967.1 hypothetical protein ABOM_004491 [Aspergillus bombycis]